MDASVAASVSAAMRDVPRTAFLPQAARRHAAQDRPLAIGSGQTNSQPTTVRNMLELLAVRPADHVLDVGTGSGWTTALLAHLTGPNGSVVGVELEPSLVDFGRANLAAMATPWARIEQARAGVLGWPDAAPYDRILVSAEAQTLPAALVDQIGARGVMVLPVAGRMLRVSRADDPGRPPQVETFGHYRFVPLR